MSIQPTLLGTSQHDDLTGSSGADVTLGLAGDDTITGAGGADQIYGDFIDRNLLTNPDVASSFDQYAGNGWTVDEDANGNTQMSQTVQTVAGAQYEVSFALAANYAAGSVSGIVEVLWNEKLIGTVDTSSGVFEDAVLGFTGTGDAAQLTFRALPGESASDINTDGPVFWYETPVQIGGDTLQVKAFAEGQANIYQVMDGQLNVFDPETETYTPAGAAATVVVNAIGYNQQDDLIYGIAVQEGTDVLGNDVSRNDLVMYDAEGNAYRIGETPYRSWTGDFDDQGNLWAFEADFDRVTMIDVDQRDANGDPVATTFKFPKEMIFDKVWDVAFDAASQSFFGMVKPTAEGEPAKLIQIDISGVHTGGEPTFTSIPVVSTEIDGITFDGVPSITFGAFVIDGDGNFYAGGNGGDHDMNDGTGTSGGIYRVEIGGDGVARLVLVSDAPKAYSNDGAVDPRSMDPFAKFDPAALVLIRGPELYEVQDPAETYDDVISAGAEADTVFGGYGEDEIFGASAGDVLSGGQGNDAVYGGAGRDSGSTIVSHYDENNLRFDQFGNLLPEDDDVISGGDGADFLHGSAGHDQLSGDAGQDTLDGGSGHDTLDGGAGDDALSGGRENDVLLGAAGADTLEGGSGDDVMYGGEGNDSLLGGSGEDILQGNDGDDHINGGAGNDNVLGGAGKDYIKGGSGNDVISSGDGSDYINAGSGDDVLDGGDGRDRLYMGAGFDVATGGAGSDRFVFRFEDLDGSTDRITDFTRDADQTDVLDFRALSLLSDMSEADWIAQHVFQGANGAVEIDLEGTVLVCEGPSQDLMAEVIDGILF